MKRRDIIISEKQLYGIAKKVLNESNDNTFNIKNVFHVSDKDFSEFEKTNFGYFFFSNKPISLNGNEYTYICNLSLHNPFIFKEGESYGYPLWLFLSDENGNLIDEKYFTREKYDGYLGCPFEFWEMVYYDDDEYTVDEIPMLVKSLNMGYDGVIIEGVIEGNSNDVVDDYIVFNKEQIEIIEKISK